MDLSSVAFAERSGWIPQGNYYILSGMGRLSLFILVVLLVFGAMFSVLSDAHAFKVEVTPKSLEHGDPFILKITDWPTREFPKSPETSINGLNLRFTTCGSKCFISVGVVDMDAEPGDYDIKVRHGSKGLVKGEIQTVSLNVLDAKFTVQRLTLTKKVDLSPEDEKRADFEEVKLKKLWQLDSPRAWQGKFILPLNNKITSPYGVRRFINGKKKRSHGGLDFRGKMGESVLAVNSGNVIMAEELFFGGNTLIIDHGMSIFSVYMHLSRFNVKLEEYVSKGQAVAEVGSTGRSTGPHLHYTLKVGHLSANPKALNALPLDKVISGKIAQK